MLPGPVGKTHPAPPSSGEENWRMAAPRTPTHPLVPFFLSPHVFSFPAGLAGFLVTQTEPALEGPRPVAEDGTAPGRARAPGMGAGDMPLRPFRGAQEKGQ
ncbi:unnamed protein product [Caretta caretta]